MQKKIKHIGISKIFIISKRNISICNRSNGAGVRLRCPIKSSGLRISSILSTAAHAAPSLHLPPAVRRLAARLSPSVRVCRDTDSKKIPAPLGVGIFLVPVTGLEPVRHRWRWILSPLRLPFHHTGGYPGIIHQVFENSKQKMSAYILWR